ncbi:MAG: tetraacyldisaccharide 4'-kinase, partial [Chitinophagales bacterium]|nr:tetraacyldisaccharide 4'-kinase [Chitinophagales bacterium]
MRKLLIPFSILYGAIILLRNKLYDAQIKKSVEFEIPVISIGNLSTGG